MGWRYIAQRISGASKGLFLHWNLPMSNVQIEDALGAGWLSGELSPAIQLATAEDGHPVIDKWCTAIWAEQDGVIRGGGIVASNAYDGPTRSVSCVGYPGYAQGQIYEGVYSKVQIDPLDIVRDMWSWIQANPRRDIGLVIDDTTSPVRVGTASENVQFTTGTGENVQFEAGPYKLNWFDVPDIGEELDNLSQETPFDMHEKHSWNADKTDITHKLELGYPRLGRRRSDLRFVLGENIEIAPQASDNGESFANYAIGVGAGEGAKMVHPASISVNDHRLLRPIVVQDKATKSKSRLITKMRQQLTKAQLPFTVEEITVKNHGNAVIGSWQPGDDILIQGRLDWLDLMVWMRVVSNTYEPDSGDHVTVKLEAL